MKSVMRMVLASVMVCGATGPLSACDSAANDKACNLLVTMPTRVKQGESLHVILRKPTCFDDMSAEKQSRETVSIIASGSKDAPAVPVKFVNGEFTHDFVIPTSAQPGKATLEIPYQCNAGASCASQSVPFTIEKA